MYIAIDDTYGPCPFKSKSRYITDKRRTSVAVVFKDEEVDYIRSQVRELIKTTNDELGLCIDEFHFTDIFNRRGKWKSVKNAINIKIIAFFAYIYTQYMWPVHIQTIDEYTLRDHGIKEIQAKAGKFDLSNRTHLSLFFLLAKLKTRYQKIKEPLTIYIDEGIYRSGTEFDLGAHLSGPPF